MNASHEENQDSLRPAVAFILPLFLFLVIASWYPNFADSHTTAGEPEELLWGRFTETQVYVGMVAGQIVVATSLLMYFLPIYRRHFPLKISWLGVVVGVIGVGLWIGICELQLERTFFRSIGLDSWSETRPAFNPFEQIDDSSLRGLFLILRFTLLAAIVPIIEELALRGWLVRWVENPQWEQVNLKFLSWKAIITPSIYGVLTHPSEAIAAFVWFGLVSWLMVRTGSLWECVMAHAVTNLLLGLYVVQFSAWHLW